MCSATVVLGVKIIEEAVEVREDVQSTTLVVPYVVP